MGALDPSAIATPDAARVRTLLARSAAGHRHACPRQILGVRMALAASELLGLALPREDKRVLCVAETDGCFLSGLEAAGGLEPARRTLRVVDCGRIAATFVDVETEAAWRLAPRVDVRERAGAAVPAARNRFAAMMEAYVVLPTSDLLTFQPVALTPPARVLVGRPHVRTPCAVCGEEVINERERLRGDVPVCPVCAGESYYVPLPEIAEAPGAQDDLCPESTVS